jgi:hypothetical protein
MQPAEVRQAVCNNVYLMKASFQEQVGAAEYQQCQQRLVLKDTPTNIWRADRNVTTYQYDATDYHASEKRTDTNNYTLLLH